MTQAGEHLRDANHGTGFDPGAESAPTFCTPAKLPLADGQRVAVLIADDHPLNRTLLKQQLGFLGLHVETAADGSQALSMWQAAHFDLIITDCQMPEMDGYELTKSIRELEQGMGNKRVPIIAWTASSRAEEEMHCLAAGMDDLLTKSTDVSGFRAKLLVWLIKSGVLAKPEP